MPRYHKYIGICRDPPNYIEPYSIHHSLKPKVYSKTRKFDQPDGRVIQNNISVYIDPTRWDYEFVKLRNRISITGPEDQETFAYSIVGKDAPQAEGNEQLVKRTTFDVLPGSSGLCGRIAQPHPKARKEVLSSYATDRERLCALAESEYLQFLKDHKSYPEKPAKCLGVVYSAVSVHSNPLS